MSWPLKISFRPNSDKEFTKELKIDSNSIILPILFSACQIFGVQDPHLYTLIHKKVKLPLFESLKGANLVPGSTISLIISSNTRDNHSVAFNYRISTDSGIKKFITQYSGSELFINSLQNIPLESGSFNPLRQLSKSPIVAILDAKLLPVNLMQCANFTLESLGLKGNYCVKISYVNLDETNNRFLEFLDANKIDQIKPLESLITIGEDREKKSKTFLSSPPVTEISALKCENKQSESFDVSFTAYRISRSTCSAPDLPDTFYELTKNEFAAYQHSFKTTTNSLIEKPFVSSKYKITDEPLSTNESVYIKFIFNDQVYVTAKFKSDTPVMHLFNFIRNEILDISSGGDIELWIGPPYQLLKCSNNSLADSGIKFATRILVKCKQSLSFNQNLKFGNG